MFNSNFLVNPQKWNKYAYTINNPLRYFDPDGFEEMSVQFRSFIQQKTVGDPIGRQFAGDNRSFTSAQNVTSRIAMVLTVMVGILVNNSVTKAHIDRVEIKIDKVEGTLASDLRRVEGVLGTKIDALAVCVN